MANELKLRKGLDIHLVGEAQEERLPLVEVKQYALVPDSFVGVKPKLTVKEGDHVLAGEALFVNKAYPEVKFASPVSGVVTKIERGERRKVLAVEVKPDASLVYRDFKSANP